MNINIRNIRKAPPPPPPPPHFLIRSVLLCFLLIVFLAVPIASQAQTPVPTLPSIQTNPTVMGPCGLPETYASFDADATVTTFNLTSDCNLPSWGTPGGASNFLRFAGQTYTINGNGYRIIGPPVGVKMFIAAGATLYLNNVIMEASNTPQTTSMFVRGILHARNVIFRNNELIGSVVQVSHGGGQSTLENVEFVDNHRTRTLNGSIVRANNTGSSIVITNSIFRRNKARTNVLEAREGGAIRFEGCLTFDGNTDLDGQTPIPNYGTSGGGNPTVIDNSTGPCPAAGFSYWLSLTPQPKRKKKEEARPTLTPTPRPAYGASYTALQTATGMTFEAAYGLDSGVHFRQLDGAGIGIQSIIDAGYLAALDVYGYVEQGVEVCFPQIGRVIFLDAQTMPRAIVPLESTVRNGMTCVSINSPGSLVLLPN